MDYKVNVPEGREGKWRVERVVVSEENAKFSALRSMVKGSGRCVPEGTYTRLIYSGIFDTTVMSDTPNEIRDHLIPIRKALGHCLINGLGLGVVLQGMLENPDVEHVTVIGLSPEVIKLVGTHYQDIYGERLTIIQADALEYKPPKGERYDVVWHDIWGNICTDNLPAMHKPHRKYGQRCGWQGSWCRELHEYHLRQEKQRGW